MNLFLTRRQNVLASSKHPCLYMCSVLEILECQKELRPTDPAGRNSADLSSSPKALFLGGRQPREPLKQHKRRQN